MHFLYWTKKSIDAWRQKEIWKIWIKEEFHYERMILWKNSIQFLLYNLFIIFYYGKIPLWKNIFVRITLSCHVSPAQSNSYKNIFPQLTNPCIFYIEPKRTYFSSFFLHRSPFLLTHLQSTQIYEWRVCQAWPSSDWPLSFVISRDDLKNSKARKKLIDSMQNRAWCNFRVAIIFSNIFLRTLNTQTKSESEKDGPAMQKEW